MILQYFKKKENKEQIIATEQYKKILAESSIFLDENNFFRIKDYNISFEIVSIFLIMFIRKNLLEYNRKLYLKVNDELMSLFISDLDESINTKVVNLLTASWDSYVSPVLYILKTLSLVQTSRTGSA